MYSELRSHRVQNAQSLSARARARFAFPHSSATVRYRLTVSLPLVAARLDRDVFDWLKRYGEGYSTRINNILRAVMSKVR